MSKALAIQIFKKLVVAVFDSVFEAEPEGDEDGEEYHVEIGAYGYAERMEFQLAALLGPEFVDCLEGLGFDDDLKRYRRGEWSAEEVERELDGHGKPPIP